MEENKVAQKLQAVLEECWRTRSRSAKTFSEDMAGAILQSPDLRVTLVEPKYRSIFTEIYDTRANDGEHVLIARTIRDEALAQEITAWLNSKEVK